MKSIGQRVRSVLCTLLYFTALGTCAVCLYLDEQIEACVAVVFVAVVSFGTLFATGELLGENTSNGKYHHKNQEDQTLQYKHSGRK